MDFRSPRPEREAAPRSEPAYTQPPEEPQPKKETPRVQHIGATHHVAKEDKSKKMIIVPILVVIAIIILVISGLLLWSKTKGGAAGIDTSKYQAVFFTNGQVYFGKLTTVNNDQMKLTDIYYLQTQQTEGEEKDSKNPQDSSTDQSNVQLIKLGNEVHGPEDAMIISRDQVLFYENLKGDSKVVQTIEQNKK